MSTLNSVFGSDVACFAQLLIAAMITRFAVRVQFLRRDAVVHVAVGDFAVGAAAKVVEVNGDVAVHDGLETAAVVVVLTSLVAHEEDDDDADKQDDERGQGADDDADVVVTVLFVLLLLVDAVRALGVVV